MIGITKCDKSFVHRLGGHGPLWAFMDPPLRSWQDLVKIIVKILVKERLSKNSTRDLCQIVAMLSDYMVVETIKRSLNTRTTRYK